MLLLVCATSWILSSAHAASITETIYGTITGGTDTAGLFGAPGTDFSGSNTPVEILFSIDSDAFGAAYQNGQGNFGNIRCCYASFQDTAGDSGEALSVTLNGQSVMVLSSMEGFFLVTNTSSSPQTDALDVNTEDILNDEIQVDFAGDSNFGQFNGTVPSVIEEAPGFFASVNSITSLTVDGESFTVSGASTTAPEPSAALLTVLGVIALAGVRRIFGHSFSSQAIK
ncbi:MAG TPA: hypothetical protein VG297_19010 [Bryobacteraceae bacterium]|nr:hypothetical protein [Bryobacteraceae bacterium]